MKTKVPTVKPVLGVQKESDANFLKQLIATHNGVKGNSAFPTPPVDLTVYKTAIDLFATLVADAADGGKKAISAKNKQRVVVTKMFKELGHYVETVSDGDVAKFNTSAFVAASTARTPAQPLPPAAFEWIDRGPNSGQVVVKPKRLPKAVNYDVRYATAGAGSTPGTWVTVTLPSAKKTTIHNLTPGTPYAFQVRAYGKLGHTDWSDSMTFIPA
jgi:Fibronectin type III domain